MDQIDSSSIITSSAPSRKRPRPAPSSCSSTMTDTIPRIPCPSLHGFLAQHMQSQVPVILTKCMTAWPAMGELPEYHDRAWRNMEYIKRVAGKRTVPVEVGEEGPGGTYLSEDGTWGTKLVTIGEFIDQFVASSSALPSASSTSVVADSKETATGGNGPVKKLKGYLAQHELFEQIPTLRKDILTPDYCALDDDDDDDDGAEDRVIVNAWFGPEGTISPTHTDPYHNLLCQVVGSKAIRLYAPSQTPYMYPHEGLMNNNSQVGVYRQI